MKKTCFNLDDKSSFECLEISIRVNRLKVRGLFSLVEPKWFNDIGDWSEQELYQRCN